MVRSSNSGKAFFARCGTAGALALPLLLGACVQAGAPNLAYVPTGDTDYTGWGTVRPISGPASPPECREFQQTIVVAGEKHPAHGTACRQPDGTWKIVP